MKTVSSSDVDALVARMGRAHLANTGKPATADELRSFRSTVLDRVLAAGALVKHPTWDPRASSSGSWLSSAWNSVKSAGGTPLGKAFVKAGQPAAEAALAATPAGASINFARAVYKEAKSDADGPAKVQALTAAAAKGNPTAAATLDVLAAGKKAVEQETAAAAAAPTTAADAIVEKVSGCFGGRWT